MQCRYSAGKRNSSQEGAAQSCEPEAQSQAFVGAFSLSSAKPRVRVPQLCPVAPNESSSDVLVDGNIWHVLTCPFANRCFFQLLVATANKSLIIVFAH